jgi:hypothetical protein
VVEGDGVVDGVRDVDVVGVREDVDDCDFVCDFDLFDGFLELPLDLPLLLVVNLSRLN